jgi:single-strand DNA-binding protein
MNSVNMIGRLTKDIETNSAGTCGSFNLAVDRKFSKEKETDFIRCKVFGKTLEIMTKFLSKGAQIGIAGRIQTGSYEKDGQKIFTTDVIVDSFSFCGGKSDGTQSVDAVAVDTGFTPIANDEPLPF